MTNLEAVIRFREHRPAWGGTLWTDGKTLYSYGRCIARWHGEALRFYDVSGISRTTSRHAALARKVLGEGVKNGQV